MSDEQIDVLDERGQPTGEILTRSQVHERELWHGVAHVWVYNQKGEVLLQLRHPALPWGGGRWDLTAGGHIVSGQKPLDAAIRETAEEIGIELKPEQLKLANTSKAENPGQTDGKIHRIYQWDYIAKAELDPSSLTMQPDEVIELKWFDLDRLKNELSDQEAMKRYGPRSKDFYMEIINKIREELAIS
jgi:isopentenyl-diphosphate delta-isomerase